MVFGQRDNFVFFLSEAFGPLQLLSHTGLAKSTDNLNHVKWSVQQWRSYIGAFRAHALPNSLSALPLSVIILVESGKRLIVLSEQFSL